MSRHDDPPLGDLGRLEGLVERLQERVDELEAENKQLRDRVADPEERTDMLQFIENADETRVEQRSVGLIEHARQKIAHADIARVVLDKDDCKQALHWPDIDRTTLYTGMQRCERLVSDRDVCFYTKASERPQKGDAVFVIDLSDRAIPDQLLNGGAPQ